MSDSIKVAIKVRPLIKREKDDNLQLQWTVQGNSIIAVDQELKKRGDGGFYFDHIFDKDADNAIVFDTIVKPIVDAAVNGFNGTVFAYGQTSSGKTYTMMGTAEELGVIPLAVEHIFNAISNTIGREFLLRVSYLEIYNEKVNDLLNSSGGDLKIHEDGTGQVIVKCKEELTNCPESVLSIMKKGNKNRRIGETNMNERSSRSHTIFRITIESREAGTDSDGAIQVSQLNLVDLAGSERARQTGATGERFKEGRHINLSLSTLGLVIMQLSDAAENQKHVNFRDSKLTRLLQASLGGNAMTAIICAVTPAALDETQCTLSFASRAKSIKNKPQVNEVMTDTALMKRYARQIAMLNAEMEKVKNEKEMSDEYNQLLEERLELLQNKIVVSDTGNQEESFKCKANRRRTWGGPTTFKPNLFPIFQPNTGLPTIKEMSPEKSHRKSVYQSVNIMNQTFQTAFADFEIELLESERDREATNDGSDSEDEPHITKRGSGNHVQFRDTLSPMPSYCEVTPEKKSKGIQTMIKSPSTPKHVLRGFVSDLTEKYDALREYTTLEKQLICEENQCRQHAEDLQKYSDLTNQMQNQDTNRANESAFLQHRQLKEIRGVSERYTDLGIKEDATVEDVISKLCQKLIALESQSRSEKDLTEQFQNRTKALEDQIQILVSERTNLCTELCEKTSELESINYKSLEEQLNKQTELAGVMQMKTQDLEAECAEHRATIDKIQSENKILKEQIIHQDDFLNDMQNKNKALRQQIMGQEELLRNLQENNNSLEKRFADQTMLLTDSIAKNNMFEEQLGKQTNAVNEVKDNNPDSNEKHKEVVQHQEENVEPDETDSIHFDVHLDNSDLNETPLDASKIIVDLEHENDRLKTDLEMKNQELEGIKNDVQSLKLDIVNLDQTIQMLTNENMELHTILSEEKKRSAEAEANTQKTINDLYGNVSTLTNEKINLETELQILKEQLQVVNSKALKTSEEQVELLPIYPEQIEKLKSENIELIALIEEKNKELEKIKESKSLLFEHDCIYKDQITDLTQQNTYLTTENDELSTDLMDKIEEIETLKTECETLKEKIKLSLAIVENAGDNDIENLRAENNILRAEVMELKMKVTTLADENATFSNNLLETMEDLSNSRRESLSNNALHLSTVFSRSTQLSETANEMIEDGNREVLVDEVLKLRSEVAHLNRLNQKLSDLKLQSCSQCAHLQSLKENHRTLKVETKHIAHRFQDLQKKFDRKCEEIEALKIKANQDINLSQLEGSLNGSFQDPLSVSFVEEKIEHLGNELRTLKDANDHLAIAYNEKCEEWEHIQEEAKSVGTSIESKTKNTSGKKKARYDEIQKSIHRVALDIDDMKKDFNNWNTVLHRYKEERANLVEEINLLKSLNEELSQKASEKELAAATFAEKAQMLEKEVTTTMKEIEQYVLKEKESESERLTLEVALEELKSDKENRDAIIEKLHKTIDELNESLSSVKNELDLMTNQKCELLTSKEAIEQKYDSELQQLRKFCEELENEEKSRIKSQEDLQLRERELQLNLVKLTSELEEQRNACSGHHEKIRTLEDLVKAANEMKEALEEKLNSAETKYKCELDLASQELADARNRSENEVKAVKEALNRYVQENNSLTQELVKMRDIEEEYNRNKNEAINRSSQEQELINDNKKLKDELNSARECIMKELKSLKHNENTMELLSKSINEIFVIFLQTLVAKEEEMIKTLREQFEKGKLKLDDERRQCQDAEKRALSWVKELEAEIEKLQADLSKREDEHAMYQENISKLDNLLRESNHERDMLREKFENLETDYSNLQVEFEKQRHDDVQQEEAIITAQKREKELQEAFKNKEIEMQTKLNAEKIIYESRIQDLTSTAEIYKMENLELKNSVENLETNEKQLKNIVNANSAEINKNNLQIERLNDQINELSKAYDEVNRIVEEKRLKINEISSLLKSKCDTVFEYKTKLDTIMPEYDSLKEQVNARKVNIERYQEEIEALKIERDNQLKMLQGKLNTEEDKNADLLKQSNDTNNRNMALVGELDELKEKYESLQQENIKLERKMRKSTSKVKAEAEMDDLRDINKRLQSNLDGASNRITELQESKNQLLKKLENLKGEYNLLQQENADLKRTILSYKSKTHISPSKDDEKYDTILYEKNRIALELEGLKLILNQKDKHIENCREEIDGLMQKNKELDKELDEYAKIIQELTDEKASLQVKLHSYLNDNNIVQDLEQKVTKLQEENDRLKKEWEALKLQNEEICKDAKSVYSLKKENAELLERIGEIESKFDVKSNSSGSRCTSPAFESTRRRHSRSEIFNQRRQLESTTCDAEASEAAERCQILRKKIRELELELVARNGKIAALEVQIQSENFPYQRKCTELQEKLLAYTKMNAELKAQITKLQRVKDEINSWDCETCRRWRVNRRDQDCQTMPNNTMLPSSTIRFSNTNTGVVHDHFIVAKLEKQNKLARELCRSRSRRIKELEDQLREMEGTNSSSVLKSLDVDKVTTNHQHGSVFPDRRQGFDKISNRGMKENIPINIMGSRQFQQLEDNLGPKIDRSASSSFFNKT